MSRRTCYFFGTFNPVHNGHLLMANQALAYFAKRLQFTSVTFVPAGNPPHRREEPGLLPARQRLHLLEQAICGYNHLYVSPVELEMASEGKVTYTYDVLTRLGELSGKYKPLVLMGQDSFETLPDWYRGDTLLKSLTFIVLERLGIPLGLEGENSDTPAVSLLSSQPNLMASFVDYHVLKIPPIGISATHIRKICRQFKQKTSLGQALSGYIPPQTLDYLMDNNLYKLWQW